jgi:hypothetical protein
VFDVDFTFSDKGPGGLSPAHTGDVFDDDLLFGKEPEGLEKTTRGGVNGSILKFIEGTRSISQNQFDASRPHSYRKAIGPQNRVRDRSENTNRY